MTADQQVPLDRLVALAGREVRRATERATAENGLGATGMRILGRLVAHGAASQRDLAWSVGVSPATLSPMMDALEAAGLLTRRRHERDRRLVVAAVTPRGAELLRAASSAVVAGVRQRMPRLDAETAAVVREYLLAVVRTFEDDTLAVPVGPAGAGE